MPRVSGGRSHYALPNVSMTRLVRRTALACACLAPLLAATPALARPDNASATQRYLAAYATRERAVIAALPAANMAAVALSGRVAGECPGVAAGAPLHTAPAETAGEEILGAVVVTIAVGLEHANARFARTVSALRWSNASLARLVRAFTAEETALAALATPDLCADLRSWAASRFVTVATGTSQFVSALQATESRSKSSVKPAEGPEYAVLRLLRAYESASDRGILRSVKLLRARVEAKLAKAALDATAQIEAAVGLTA
jgi:hypothetical protein